MRLLPVLLFATLPLAAATPFIGPEITSAPYASLPLTDCSEAAIVAVGEKTFLAWAADTVEGAVVNATLLDQNFSSIAATETRLERNLFVPECLSAATSGGEVALVWRERTLISGFSSLIGVRYSASSGQIVQGPVTMLPTFHHARTAITYFHPVYAVVAGNYRLDVTASDLRVFSLYAVRDWLSAPGFSVRAVPLFDSVAAGSGSYAAVVRLDQGPIVLGIAGRFGTQPGFSSIGVLHPHPLFEPKELSTAEEAANSRTSVACIADDCLVTWQYSAPLGRFKSVRARWTDRELIDVVGELSSPFVADATIASASDGERILIVWDDPGTRDVRGVFATRDEITPPFVIASGDGLRRRPSVAALEDGRFLVAYEISAGATRLGGRLVATDLPSKRRAVTK